MVKTIASGLIAAHNNGIEADKIKLVADELGVRYCNNYTWIFKDKSVLEIKDTLIERPF